jgi:hypothetical protein
LPGQLITFSLHKHVAEEGDNVGDCIGGALGVAHGEVYRTSDMTTFTTKDNSLYCSMEVMQLIVSMELQEVFGLQLFCLL